MTAGDAGVYLTDGRQLFRVVALLTPPDDTGSAELEDCMTLEVLELTADELWRMQLEPVGAG